MIINSLIAGNTTIKESIESIQNQTYTNLEIIVIDDGSSDNTYNIVEKLAKDDNRIKLYKNETIVLHFEKYIVSHQNEFLH